MNDFWEGFWKGIGEIVATAVFKATFTKQWKQVLLKLLISSLIIAPTYSFVTKFVQEKVIVTATPQSTTTPQLTPDPQQLVLNYYENINARNYSAAWQVLPEALKNNLKVHPNGFDSFRDWHDTVEKIDIKNVYKIYQTENNAVIGVNFNYVMKNGSVSSLSLKHRLEFSTSNNSWILTKISNN